MNYLSVPIILIICYMIGDAIKIIFKENKKITELIPFIVSIVGGILGVLIYLTSKEMIFNVDNIWIALEIGIVSGASSTSTNQIIKKIRNRGGKYYE